VRLDEIAMQVAWWLLGGRGSAFYSSSIDATAVAAGQPQQLRQLGRKCVEELTQSDWQRSGSRSTTWVSANHERRQINPEPQ
jgi:hypothetical protein